MNKVLIALGSNIGDRSYWISQALHYMQILAGNIQAISKFHETEPIGTANLPFLNGACIIETRRAPEDLMRTLLKIENFLQRDRTIHWGNRTIDLDIILWKNADGTSLQFYSPQLEIPHPESPFRPFVLIPAAEIAGDWLHPLRSVNLNKLVADLVPSHITGTESSPSSSKSISHSL